MIKSILSLIIKHAEKNPDHLALADKANHISYIELITKIKVVAKFLVDMGVQKGDVIAIRSEQNIEFAIGFYGIQYMGGIACPIEKTASEDRVIEVMNQISASLIFDHKEYIGMPIKVLSLTEAMNSPDSLDTCAVECEEDIADIIFTTGTTGQSKGILVSHRSDLAIAENVIGSVEMEEDEVELITSPMSHSLAIRRLNAAMYIGSAAVITDSILIYKNFWGLIEKYHVTAITSVPANIGILLEAYKDKFSEYDRQLHYIQLGSATLQESLKNALRTMMPSVRLYNTYGSTESGCTIVHEFSKYEDKPYCVGKTTVNTDVFFVDETRKNRINAFSIDTAGIMCFKGPMNMSGYVNDPKMTAEVLADGVIYTNDIGYIGEDGFVYLIGRVGEVINCGGYKINPSEIEEVVLRISGISDCACIGIDDDRCGEIVKLYIACDKEFKEEDSEIKDYLRKYLESYKIPEQIERISEIPRTHNGKIIRRLLK